LPVLTIDRTCGRTSMVTRSLLPWGLQQYPRLRRIWASVTYQASLTETLMALLMKLKFSIAHSRNRKFSRSLMPEARGTASRSRQELLPLQGRGRHQHPDREEQAKLIR